MEQMYGTNTNKCMVHISIKEISQVLFCLFVCLYFPLNVKNKPHLNNKNAFCPPPPLPTPMDFNYSSILNL